MSQVFFYGLFMDEDLLREKGFNPSAPMIAYVDDYGLRIGAKATMLPLPGERAYGTLMELSDSEVESLYGEAGVADYEPVPVTAVTMTDDPVSAVSYLLPEAKLSGTNAAYLDSLISIAEKIGLPGEYIEELKVIREAGP